MYMVKQERIIEFEWDKGNIDKNYEKHGITPNQAEEAFLDERLKVKKDFKHSQKEERQIALGKNLTKNILFIVFTRRKNKIRIISARMANIKEKRNYEKT